MKIDIELLNSLSREQLIKLAIKQDELIATQNEVIEHFKFNHIITQQAITDTIALINDRA